MKDILRDIRVIRRKVFYWVLREFDYYKKYIDSSD